MPKVRSRDRAGATGLYTPGVQQSIRPRGVSSALGQAKPWRPKLADLGTGGLCLETSAPGPKLIVGFSIVWSAKLPGRSERMGYRSQHRRKRSVAWRLAGRAFALLMLIGLGLGLLITASH